MAVKGVVCEGGRKRQANRSKSAMQMLQTFLLCCLAQCWGREAQEYRKPDIAVAQLRNDAGVAETSGSPGGNSGRFKRDLGKKIPRPWRGWDGTTSSAGPDLAGAAGRGGNARHTAPRKRDPILSAPGLREAQLERGGSRPRGQQGNRPVLFNS